MTFSYGLDKRLHLYPNFPLGEAQNWRNNVSIGFGEKENEVKAFHGHWSNKWENVREKCPVLLNFSSK